MKQNHADSLGRKPFFTDGSFRRKQEIGRSLGRNQYDGQFRMETKMGGLLYTI